MIALTLVAPLLLAGADDLAPTQIERVKLSVPAAWKKTVAEGSHRFDAPSEDASFELSVFPVDPKRAAKLCLDQLLEALGPEGWAPVKAGGAPAARKVATESQPGEEGKPPTEVRTLSYVGCDGATKWVLTMTLSEKKKSRFEPLADRIVKSLSYSK